MPSYRLGHVEAYKIPNTPDDQSKVGYYLSKYITKDMPRFFNKNRYWASHGLDLPRRTYGLPDWYGSENAIWRKKTKYGLVSYYLNRYLPATESHSLTEDSPAPSPEGKEV